MLKDTYDDASDIKKKKLHESGQQKEDINLLCCFGVA